MTIFSEIAFNAWARAYATKRPIAKLFRVHPCICVSETAKRRPTNRDRLRALIIACLPAAGALILVALPIWMVCAVSKLVAVRALFGTEDKYQRWLNN
jgi:hypothetical protein